MICMLNDATYIQMFVEGFINSTNISMQKKDRKNSQSPLYIIFYLSKSVCVKCKCHYGIKIWFWPQSSQNYSKSFILNILQGGAAQSFFGFQPGQIYMNFKYLLTNITFPPSRNLPDVELSVLFTQVGGLG